MPEVFRVSQKALANQVQFNTGVMFNLMHLWSLFGKISEIRSGYIYLGDGGYKRATSSSL